MPNSREWFFCAVRGISAGVYPNVQTTRKTIKMLHHLIANSGIQFIVKEIELNPTQPLMIGQKMLRYTFCDCLNYNNERVFDLLCEQDGTYYSLSEAVQRQSIEYMPNGNPRCDEFGVAKMIDSCDKSLLTAFGDGDEQSFSVNNLSSYNVRLGDGARVPAFSIILGKWLPMPVIETDTTAGIAAPLAWARVNIQECGDGASRGSKKFRLTWAFDTELDEDELSYMRPTALIGDHANFGLCNRADLLLDFLSSDSDTQVFSNYIASLLGLNLNDDSVDNRFKGWYIYLINLIRLSGGAPDVQLHNNMDNGIDVDLVLDIGNSRTCGILFEEGDFTRAKMLSLRDMSKPWVEYEDKSFDMRVAFRRADFGNDMPLDMFVWKSFVRVGEEAKRLVYRSLEDEGLSEKATNYSSPKRYLWDDKPFDGQWENLITVDDPFNIRYTNDIYVAGLSEQFNSNGEYQEDGIAADFDPLAVTRSYSRSSLMTFAFIEIFNQAIMQVNSEKLRKQWGRVDCRRNLRNIIVTCPTAMPIREQVRLRQAAKDAYAALCRCVPGLKPAQIYPTPESIAANVEDGQGTKKMWSYDEASCCQLVYLYAEIAKRHGGRMEQLVEQKGHKRPSIDDQKNTLTIGSVDIGAGTTDLMICAWQYDNNGQSILTPHPLFWDSFYQAGDDILKNLVQDIVIEGKFHGQGGMGSVSAAVTARIEAMSDEELRNLPCLRKVTVYKEKVDSICSTLDEADKHFKKISFASNLIHDFFGNDSAMMSHKDRVCRLDFNTQVSVPIAQKMMDLLRLRRPVRTYSYEELFPEFKPADYLLKHFEEHFGFSFTELSWKFDPEEVAGIVEATMEPLMKQLALVLYAQHCDIILLSGRPTSIDAITELFVKYVPTTPDRLIRLNDYRVGNWFPTADGQGYFFDQKSTVAVGGMVGHLSCTEGSDQNLVIDFSQMIQKMKPTADYIGIFDEQRQQVRESVLDPVKSSETIHLSVFPAVLGCRQLGAPNYQARPLYVLYDHSGQGALDITLERPDYLGNKEEIVVCEATDRMGRSVKKKVELVQQSLTDGGKHWLDKGEFVLTIK